METPTTETTSDSSMIPAKIVEDSPSTTPTEEESFTDDREEGSKNKEENTSDPAALINLNGILNGILGTSSNDTMTDGPMLRATKEGLGFYDLNYKELPPEEDSDRRIITFSIRCDCGIAGVYLAVREEERKFSFYLKSPTLVPLDLRTKAVLFLTRVNYGLVIGNFELDLNDGEVRFKWSCHTPGSELSPDMVKHAVGSSVSMLDRFFPGLMAVLYGGKDPKEAYDNCITEMDSQAQ